MSKKMSTEISKKKKAPIVEDDAYWDGSDGEDIEEITTMDELEKVDAAHGDIREEDDDSEETEEMDDSTDMLKVEDVKSGLSFPNKETAVSSLKPFFGKELSSLYYCK